MGRWGGEGGRRRRRDRSWMYSIRGDGRRICETSLRKYAQLNFSTPMVSSSSSSPPFLPQSPSSVRAVPFVNHPRFPLPARLSSPSVLRRSPFTSSPSNSPSGLLPRPASIPLFLVAAYFFCLASLAPALGRARLYLFHPSSPPPSAPPSPRSLFCHGALVLALSHSICHPPSFHHPSKPWSLTGDTHTCARARARARARALACTWRVGDADGGASWHRCGGGRTAPDRAPSPPCVSSPSRSSLAPFFSSRYSARGIPGWDLQDPANMRPIKATRPRSNLSAAITRGFRDGRILPAGFTAVRGIPVPLCLPPPRRSHRGRRAGKCPADFSDRLIRRITRRH